tara:strand:+ start:8935 stop:11571 length:2637 start_codon:yes stop_codon:yes gene_type:complete
MPLHVLRSKAVRLNGYTDGMIVPTGAYRESGVDLFNAAHSEKTGGTNKVSSYESDDPKVGQRHHPNEGNNLNNLIGPFTLEAFVIPDRGGVILHKEDGYTLKVGEPFSAAPAVFELHTRTSSGGVDGERVTSALNFPLSSSNWATYTGGETKPHDLDLPSRELLYVNAQFTGKRMKIYINTDLVADMDFGGEERILKSSSSDIFIGGRGGEYRGIIESVRISRGVVEPKMQPLTLLADTVGLWMFEDEDDTPNLHFFNNRNPAHPHQGKDGVGSNNDGLMPQPMVCVGYDFTNVAPGGAVTPASGHPLTLASGYDYGYFRIRDFPDSVVAGLTERPTALELLASYMLSIPVEELPLQSWWGGGILDVSSQITGAHYHSDGIPVSNLNAIVNASGTDPMTGGTVSSFGYHDSSPEGGVDLDPMVNPIERMRIVAIDFEGNVSSPARPPCVVVQSTILSSANANPQTQGFLFDHPDNTPIWFTLGNGDLVIDPGFDAPIGSRVSGQMTRARFTQNQRFSDGSKHHNDAYFISTHSRFDADMQTQVAGVAGSAATYEPPMSADLVLWLDANDKTTVKAYNGASVVSNDQFVHWWRNKSPTTTNYHFYGWGGWRWKQNCGNANNRAGLVVASPAELVHQYSTGEFYPDGMPTIAGTVKVPVSALNPLVYYDGAGWVSGKGTIRLPEVSGVTGVMPFGSEHLSALYGGGPSMTDGDWSFYLVMTPAYVASRAITLVGNVINDGFDLQLDNGSGSPVLAATGCTIAPGSANRPTAGTPCLVSARIDESASKIYWSWRNQGGTNGVTAGSGHAYATTNPVIFDSTNTQTGGLEILGKLTAAGAANNFTNYAPPGFIIHEVLAYPKFLSTAEDNDVQQWFEDRYGV